MAMRGYGDDDRNDYEDYYESEGEEYEEEGEGDEYEEEEAPKPTKEELEYLQLRQKLKESIRKKIKKENGSSNASSLDSTGRRKTKLPYDNFGSFFGPSQPVIAQRVIHESKTLLENQHLASRIHNPLDINKNQNKVSNGGSKSSSHNVPPRVSEVKVKAQKLKDTRDYSFLLSDDAELPAPSKAPPPRNMSIQNSEARPAQVPVRSKPPLSKCGKLVRASNEERKPGSLAGHLPPKSGSSLKLNSTHKPSTSADSRKHLGNISGCGPGRPVGPKSLPPKTVGTTRNKSSIPVIRNPLSGVPKSAPSKSHSSISKHSVEQRQEIREPYKPKMIPKQPVALSKPQINKPLKQNSMHTDLQDHHPKNKVKRRHSDDVEDKRDISSMIRSMFGYNPTKYVDDDNDDNMEAGFDEILREERRSATIAKREDDEQQKLIEEEAKREQRRRLAKLKKRKIDN